MITKCSCLLLLGLLVGMVLAEEETLDSDHIIVPSWFSSMFSVKPRQLRADTERNDRTFWATRGKRGGIDMVIKPNGFFSVGKRAFKPNGLFNIKRGFKPNNLFNIHKRSFMKPNGLFATFEGGKRSHSLKPNGFFALTKRSQENLLDVEDVSMPISFPIRDREYFWGSPMGLFGSYKKRSMSDFEYDDESHLAKRSLKPNGLFSIGKRSSLDYDYAEDDSEDLIHIVPAKRETFWATRGKREPEMFWATRGKREPGNFWAVRG